MKKNLCLLVGLALVAGITHADLISADLNLLANGSYSDATVVTTSQSYGGATFDVVYTISAISAGDNTFIASADGLIGIGDDDQVFGSGRDETIDGSYGEFLSFTGLEIVNFNAGTSGLLISDITGLTFAGLSVMNAANKRDEILVSFDNYTTSENYDLYNIDEAAHAIDLTGLTSYGSTETTLNITPDSEWTSNRISITGISVQYDVVPEPATIGMLGLGALLAMLMRRVKGR